MLEINSSQIRRSEFKKYLIDYMRVFYTFSSTPTAASSNDQIQKFYFFPEERGRPMVY